MEPTTAMNGHQQTHNPYAQNQLFTHNRDGVPSPPGYGFNVIGQLVPLAYQPWMFGPQQAWESFYNPEFLAWGQSDATIEPQPSADPNLPARWGKDPLGRAVPPVTHQDVALVPNWQYVGRELDDPDRPTQDNGTLALTGIGVTGAPARINFKVAQSIASYVFVPNPNDEFALAIQDPSQPTPLGVPPVQAAITDPPVGGAVSVAHLSFGHKGTQIDVVYDVPPGQTVAIPIGASQGITSTFLTPKYFHNTAVAGGEPGTGFRSYLLFPLGPPLTQPPGTPGGSNVWNSMTAQALAFNNFPGLQAPQGGSPPVGNPNSTPFLAWFALAPGIVPIPETQATRRFYGTVLSTVALPNPLANPIVRADHVTVAPIANNASTVKLVANPGLNFIIRGNSPFANYGPFPANTEITIPANATSIIVFTVANLTQPGVPQLEEFFELVYTLSFG
jgi:hypothetical protein